MCDEKNLNGTPCDGSMYSVMLTRMERGKPVEYETMRYCKNRGYESARSDVIRWLPLDKVKYLRPKFDEFDGKFKEWKSKKVHPKDFISNGGALYLCGDTGIGKTTLAAQTYCSVAKENARAKRKIVGWNKFSTILSEMKKSERDPDLAKEFWDIFYSEILIIDNLEKLCTATQSNMFLEFLERTGGACYKWLIITSNHMIGELNFEAPVKSRLASKDNFYVQLEGKDLRR